MVKSLICLLPMLIFASCSFDYGDKEGSDKSLPDIVMDNVEYVRVRSGDPLARFKASRAERYEERRVMQLRQLSFEQFEKQNGDVNALGKAGSAEFMIDTSDITMDDGVRIDVESEDITIETKQLEWKDNARILRGGTEEAVNIYRKNGTSFSGIGFVADARKRTWEFSEGVSGTYIHDDDKKDKGEEDGELPDRDTGERPPYPSGVKKPDLGK